MTTEQKERVIKDIEETKKLMLKNSPEYGMLMSLSGTSSFDEKIKYDSLYTSATEDMSTYYKEFKNPTTFLSIDALSNDPIIKLPTNHVQYGQSKDMSHDMALILKK